MSAEKASATPLSDDIAGYSVRTMHCSLYVLLTFLTFALSGGLLTVFKNLVISRLILKG